MRPPLKGGLSKMASPCKMLQVTLGEDHHQWKRDMHPNGEIIKRGYDAFGRGDMPTVFGILDAEIRWHVPGQSPLSGDYRGHSEVMGFFKQCIELSHGTLRIDVHDIVANESRVFALCTVSATRAERYAEFVEVHLWRIVEGRAVEFCEFQGDEHTENKFWA